MSPHFSVRWTVLSTALPRPWLRCAHCGESRPFVPSGKARLNANGRRLDGWLIYRCATCEATWNRPVFERRAVTTIPRTLLEAMQANDPATLDGLARDASGLGRFTPHVETPEDVAIRREVLSADAACRPALTLDLDPATPLSIRVDRLLAEGLGLSRSRVAALARDRALRADPAITRPLRGPISVFLDLNAAEDAQAILDRAAGRGR